MDQQNRFPYFQGNSPQSLGGVPMEWTPEYQTADWGGVPMVSTGSNSTVNSSDSRYSIATAATSISGPYTMDSPSRKNFQYSPTSYQASFGNLSLGESSTASAPNYSSQYTSQNERPTPSSIPWDMEVMRVSDFYDFIVVKGKEPYLQLNQRYNNVPTAPLLPQIVYLDEDRHSSGKKRHPCFYPGQGCWKSNSRPNFARSADRDRHYNVVHFGSAAVQFPCDYTKCSRNKDAFTRKDHCRDHYKEFHKEDIGEPKGGKLTKDRARWEEKQREWEAERRRDLDWWRCPKCLDRVHVKKNGWTCSGCKRNCERSRIDARTKPATTSTVEDKSLLVGSDGQNGLDYRSPYPGYPYCGTCKDTRSVANSIGGYDNCPSCCSGYYEEAPYDERPYGDEEPSSASGWAQPRYEEF